MCFRGFRMQKTILDDFDNKVAKKIEDPTELEQDIFDAEELRSVIIENIQHIHKFLEVSLKSNNEKPVLVTDPSTSGVIPLHMQCLHHQSHRVCQMSLQP